MRCADLLAVGGDGTLHVFELKRDRTPRDVVAQILDYGSWTEGLSHAEVISVFNERHDQAFEVAFADRFGSSPPELNAAHKLTVVATDMDPATERIITYLNSGFAVRVNVVFFRYFQGQRAGVPGTDVPNGSGSCRRQDGCGWAGCQAMR
jgi:hypothetical protein